MLKFDSYISVPMPSNEIFEKNDEFTARSQLYKTLDIFDRGKMISYKFEHIGNKEIKIKLLSKNERQVAVKKHKSFKKGFENSEVLHASIKFSNKDISQLDSLAIEKESRYKRKDIYTFLLLQEFIKAISNISVSLNIAYPGSFEIDGSNTFINDKHIDNSNIELITAWELQAGVRNSLVRGWPKIRRVPFDKVWKWSCSNQDFFDGFINNSVARSLNAYSRLLENDLSEAPLHLLWGVIGIESLYSDGFGNTGNQVKERLQLLVGQNKSCSKILNNIYKCRSKFIHGKMDFPPLHLLGDARVAVEKYDSEIKKASEDVSVILAVSLQIIVRRGMRNLDFKYAIKNEKLTPR